MNTQLIDNLTFIELDYDPNRLIEFFSAIEPIPWSMLLHSSTTEHCNGRYDILVADPIITLETVDEITTIEIINKGDKKQTVTSDACPFTLLSNYQSKFTPHHSPIEDIPFIGGALGYFSYDLGRRLETLPQRAKKEIQAADMAVGIYNWALIADHQKNKLTLIQPKDDDRLDWLQKKLSLKQAKAPFALRADWRSNMTPEAYADKFHRIQDYLLSGDCYQINLTQRFKAQYSGSEWQAYQQLARNNQTPFSAFIRTPELAVLSLSPERFLQVKGNQIETKPIKGTASRSKDPAIDQQQSENLKNSAKDRAENLMIVDLLRNDIGRIAKPGSVKVPTLFEIESFPAVHHLVSTIIAELDQNHHAYDLLKVAFPGGSITGAPKIRAMEIIEELEPHRRHLYCGSIGYISRCGTMDTSITIRTLLAYHDHLYVSAGGGIVADSQVECEYQESLDKLAKILPILTQKT